MLESYIAVMQQGLQKKLKVLDEILAESNQQMESLKDPKLTVEAFDACVERKAKLIEELTLLEDGFDAVYEKVADELKHNKDQYAGQIKQMQVCIKLITDRSVKIQATEARNKELAMQKFQSVRQQKKTINSTQNAMRSYRQNMLKLNLVDPQFMDNKH